jgi:hypothetical protein
MQGATDGKTVRGSFNTRQETRAIHPVSPVSARVTTSRPVFARVKTGEKSTEIVAILALPEMTTLPARRFYDFLHPYTVFGV